MTVAVGWYVDPQTPGLLRWWDGVDWTSHVIPAALPSDAASIERWSGHLRAELDQLRTRVVETADAMILQEVGLYKFSHPLDNAEAH